MLCAIVHICSNKTKQHSCVLGWHIYPTTICNDMKTAKLKNKTHSNKMVIVNKK